MVGKEEGFDATKERVLHGDVPWDTYVTAKLISGTDLQLLRRYDHRSREVQSALLEENGAAYVHTFINVLRNVFKEETVEYTIALLHELLSVDKQRAQLFFSPPLSPEDVYKPLLRLLTSSSWFVQEATCYVLATVLSNAPLSPSSSSLSSSSVKEEVTEEFLTYICNQLSHPSHPSRSLPACIAALAVVLRDPSARTSFVGLKAGGVVVLSPFIAPASSQQQMQLLYDALLCLWLLSFTPAGVEAIVSAHLLPPLVDVAKASSKEKIVRVAALTLSNLLSRGHVGPSLVELGLPKVVASLKMQAWHDEDLTASLSSLETGLRHHLRVMSSFDKFRQEVASGRLDWTPVHKDPAFWRENLASFEDNAFQVLKDLVSLLSSSPEPRTQAVACHDLGQFIAAHPSGRSVALDLKAKEAVIKLLDSPDGDVRKHALLALQKLLLSAKYASFMK